MKKKLLALLLLLLIPLSVAYATTTHYSYVTPTVGGSQNTWGTLLNTIFGTIDSNIWSASGGTTIGLGTTTTAGNFILTNPVNNVNTISFTTTGKHVALPVMNATASPVPGGVISFINSGSNAYQITANDGTTNVIASVAAGQAAYVQALTNSTTNGTWQAYGPFLTSIGTLSLGSATNAASPAISGDATTGFYTPGAAQAAVTISGTQRVLWNSSGESVNGALSFTSTVGAAAGVTGVYSPVANSLAFETTGGEALRITSTQSVGIGTTTPTSKLTVGGTFNTTGVATLDGIAYPAAVTSGGIPYFSSTSAVSSSGALTANAVVLGGGAGTTPATVSGTGTAGQVLTSNGASAPTWQNGGGFALLSTVTASAAASVTFGSSLITSAYNNYDIECDNVSMNTIANDLLLTISTNNGVGYLSSSYHSVGTTMKDSVSTVTGQTGGSANVNLDFGVWAADNFYPPTAQNYAGRLSIKFSNPSASLPFNIEWILSAPRYNTGGGALGDWFRSTGSGGNIGTTAINNIKIAPSAGAETMNCHLYGLGN